MLLSLTKLFVQVFVVAALLLSQVVSANPFPGITIAVGWSKPPYVIQRDDSGYELELVRRIFAELGAKVNFVYVPYGRSHLLVEQRRVDAALTISEKLQTEGLLLSDVYINYQNVAVSLKSKNLELDTVEQLSDFTIAAFQNASEVLGPTYHNMSQNNPFYIELPDQFRQVEMLLNGKVDVVVMDANIFVHIASSLLQNYQDDDFTFYSFFPPSQYRVGFHDRILRARFNKALEEYLGSQDYKDLVAAYPRYSFEQSQTQ